MRLLVLGGTAFVGRAVVEDALARGWPVTTYTRASAPVNGAEALHGNRLVPGDLEVLRGGEWDAVVDTWSGAPRAVRDSARLLADRVGHYGYVFSRSVYADIAETSDGAPVVAASADAESTEYPADKRGAELAVLAAYGDRALLARAGLVLGPHEDVGRLPWWLLRMRRGGRVLAPGPVALPLQYVDARDLAGWMLDCADRGVGGKFNAVSPPGHTTMGELLERCHTITGGRAELVWTPPEVVLAAGIEPWTQLPIWVPPGHPHAGIHHADTSRARAAGLSCRPVGATVADTWAWLLALDEPPPLRADRPAPGLDPAIENAVLARR